MSPTLTRRAALLGGLSIPALAAMRRGLFAAEGKWARPAIVTITGATADLPLARLTALCQPFFDRGIQTTLAIAPERLLPGSDLAGQLREYADENGFLFEVAIDAADVGPDPYRQLRQASAAQAAFSWAMNPARDHTRQTLLTATTLVTAAPVRSPDDFAAMRAAGIRTVIHAPAGEGAYAMTSTGLANAFGPAAPAGSAEAAGEAPRPDALGNRLRSTSGDAPIAVGIPLARLAALSDGDLGAYTVALAGVIAAARDAGAIRPVLPYELYTQSRAGAARYVILRVDDLRANPDADPAHRQFVADLLQAGYALTEAVVPASGGLPLAADAANLAFLRATASRPGFAVATEGWAHDQDELIGNGIEADFALVAKGARAVFAATGQLPSTYVPSYNRYDENLLDAVGGAGFAMQSAEKGDFRWFAGLDRRGILHASNTIGFEREWTGEVPYFSIPEMLGFFGTRNDAVFVVNPGTATSPERRQTVLDTLAALAGQPGTALTNFDGYDRAVMAPMPAFDVVRASRAEVHIRDAKPGGIDEAEAGRLREDAVLAWQYFDWGAAKFGGIAPGTGWEEYGAFAGYPFVTMWDLASQIMATIVAHHLKIIDQAKFEASIRTVLAFIGTSAYIFEGARLPDVERPLGPQPATQIGVDAADTGRLLTCLRILDEYSAHAFPVAALVAGWGLKTLIPGGVMHSISAAGAVEIPHNSYSQYARRGYLLWGFDVAPIFAETPADMDRALAFLAEVEQRGRIATEPNVTEMIELGGSEHNKILADMLLAAQIKRYRDTGILTCVSEGPIDEVPYFTYQAYQLGDHAQKWTVDARSKEQKALADDLGDRLRMVSTKGSFLWAAARPGAYADALVGAARRKARIEGLGFASGIREATGKPTNLSDVNTNALILEAIAFILNGRRPLVTLGINAGMSE